LKADPQGLVRVIGPLFRRIWEECVFPEEWGLSDVSPIIKEGKARDSVDSYRPIYLIFDMCKLFSLMLASRITHHIETNKLLGAEHMGFRRKKGCEETAATLWQLLSVRKRQGSRTFVGFLDIYNMFPIEGLFEVVCDTRRLQACPTGPGPLLCYIILAVAFIEYGSLSWFPRHLNLLRVPYR
jgi:hypothetical protein